MDIKLNKELQNELDIFLANKNDKLQKLLEIVKQIEFSFSKEEINSIEEIYKKNNSLREYIHIYIGEAVIKIAGGFWSIGKFKKDEAYGLPIILGWGGREDSPRLSPDVWLKRIDTDRLGKPLGEMIYSL